MLSDRFVSNKLVNVGACIPCERGPVLDHNSLLKAQGIEPLAVAGHSVGEVAAAWACGALDLDVAIRVIVARSRSGETRGTGRMAAVGLSEEAMQATLAELGGDLDITIAGINSPKNLTLSGRLADLERAQSHLAPKGVFFRLLELDYAFHSRQMDPIRESLLASLAGLKPALRQELPSSRQSPAAYLTAINWMQSTGGTTCASPCSSPRPSPPSLSLAAAASSKSARTPSAALYRRMPHIAGSGGCRPPCARRPMVGIVFVEATLRAHLLAEQPTLGVYFRSPRASCPVAQLPLAARAALAPAHQRKPFVHRTAARASVLGLADSRGSTRLGKRPRSDGPALARRPPGRGRHRLPGAAYAEMARLAAAREWLGGEALAFEEMDIVSPMVFDGERARLLRFELNERDGSFQIKSRQRLSQDAWTAHAAGRILQLGARSASIAPLSTDKTKVDQEPTTAWPPLWVSITARAFRACARPSSTITVCKPSWSLSRRAGARRLPPPSGLA